MIYVVSLNRQHFLNWCRYETPPVNPNSLQVLNVATDVPEATQRLRARHLAPQDRIVMTGPYYTGHYNLHVTLAFKEMIAHASWPGEIEYE